MSYILELDHSLFRFNYMKLHAMQGVFVLYKCDINGCCLTINSDDSNELQFVD